MTTDLLNLTAHGLSEKIVAGEVSVREAAEAANGRVEAVDGDLNSFVTTTPELGVDGRGCHQDEPA